VIVRQTGRTGRRLRGRSLETAAGGHPVVLSLGHLGISEWRA
jgi:hypothetical protein